MRIYMQMKWEGVTPEQYDASRKAVNMDENYPVGLVSHVAAFGDNAIHVTDIWESAEDFNNYVQSSLMPATSAAGMTGEPQVHIYPVHATLVPAMQTVA